MRITETLTYFELLHTYGFWKIMSVIWAVPILSIILAKLLKRNKLSI